MPANRDRFGGRPGSQAYAINAALVALGANGGTPEMVLDTLRDAAQQAGNVALFHTPLANVSAQLSWLYNRGLIGRRDSYSRSSRSRFVYFVIEGVTAEPRNTVYRNTVSTDRTFGVELEVILPGNNLEAAVANLNRELQAAGVAVAWERYTHRTTQHWKIVTDASLQPTRYGEGVGLEIVSPVLRGVEGEEAVKVVCEVLSRIGARVNRTCGLHVHISNEGLSPQRKRKLYAAYGAVEHHIDSFMPVSRRASNNSFLQSCRLASYGSTRYTKLNVAMLERSHPTVEFRQHSGTTEAGKILPWIRFCKAFINATDLNAVSNANSLPNLLSVLGLAEGDVSYFLERAADLNSAVAA